MTRKEARELIFGLVFETEFRAEESVEEIYATSAENREIPEEGFVKGSYFAICDNIEEIDRMIGEHANGWKTSRLGRVSRSILRIAVYEMMFRTDIPLKVSINEALELAKRYDEEKARPFINGVLNSVKESLVQGGLRSNAD